MTRTEATAAKLKLLQAIAEDSTLAPTDYRLAILLLTRHFNAEKGCAWPSRTRLAEETGVALCTVTRALKRLETGGHFAVRRDKGRSHTNRYYPAFVAVDSICEEKVASVPPIRNDGNSEKVALTPIKGGVDAHKRVHGRHTTPFTTPIKNPLKGRASLASPPDGGSRSALLIASKKDSRQEDGERLDDVEPPVTPEQVRKIMRDFRASLKATEEGEEATCAATSAKSAERLSRQEANWQREMAAVAQHAAQRGNGEWKQEVRDY